MSRSPALAANGSVSPRLLLDLPSPSLPEDSACIPTFTAVKLPNGRRYQFQYSHPKGYLTKIIYPSGGYVAFDYETESDPWSPEDRYIVGRRVSENGTTEVSWTYSRSYGGGMRIATVTDPAGHQVVHLFDPSDGFERQTQWKENDSADPSKIVFTNWGGPRPNEIITRIGSLEQKQTITWDGAKQTETTQSDWYWVGNSPTPLTRTQTGYWTITSGPTIDIIPDHVLKQHWNGSAYVTDEFTSYFYDGLSLASVSGVPHHNTPSNPRRNLTTVRHYKDGTNYLDENFYYDVLGNLIEHVDTGGHSTTFVYTDSFSNHSAVNSYAFPTLVTNAEGHAVATAYDYNTGLPTSVIDARSLTTTFTYDGMDRPLTVTEPNGRITTTTYTEPDPGSGVPAILVSTKVASGSPNVYRKTETTFDKLGRPVQVKQFDPGGDVFVDTQYNELGQAWKVSLPYRSGTPLWTQTAFDELGRPVTVEHPDSTSVSIAYTANAVVTTDEAGIERRSYRNGLGQLIQVEEPNPTLSTPLITTYTYTASGLLTGVAQDGQSRSFSYNWLGQLLSETHPETGTTDYSYYDDGSLHVRTDARGIDTTYSYDDIGRLLHIDYEDSTPDVTYAYDDGDVFGFLTSVSVDGVTESEFEYNAAGLLTQETVTHDGASGDFTTQYSYDLDGRLLSITYPSGRVVTQSYAASSGVTNDQLASLENGPTSSSLLGSVAANAAGQITSQTLGNGITETRSYSSQRLQLTGISATQSSTTLLDLAYGYGTTDNTGRIRSRTDNQQPEHSAAYTFDNIGRLTNVANSQWEVSWTLDRWGNRLSQTPSGLANGPLGSPALTYTGNKISGVTYDAAGNVTYDGTSHYYYDAENRLISIDSSDIEYAYNAAGQRIRKSVTRDSTTVSTYYFYGLTGLMSEFSTDDTYSNATTAASTDRLTYRIGEPTGTAVLLADGGGTVRENNRVFPFGEPWRPFAESNNNEKFTTYQHDDESGLDYAMARYYASRSGQFMTPDPGHVGADLSNPQSWNAYAYVGNDPINFVDPNGTEIYSLCLQTYGCGDYGSVDEYEQFLRSRDLEFFITPLTPGQPSTVACRLLESSSYSICGTLTMYPDAPKPGGNPKRRDPEKPGDKPTRRGEPFYPQCGNAPPMLSTAPNPYSPSDRYLSVSARSMFKLGGDGAWGNTVRSCLECLYKNGAESSPAHQFCYGKADVRNPAVAATGFTFAVTSAARIKISEIWSAIVKPFENLPRLTVMPH